MTKPTPIHNAALIKAAADGYQMQVRRPDGWRDTDTMHALNLLANQHPMSALAIVRVKPTALAINGVEVPEPMRYAPLAGNTCWLADPTSPEGALQFDWSGGNSQRMWLAFGLLHHEEDAAIAHSRALLSFATRDAP